MKPLHLHDLQGPADLEGRTVEELQSLAEEIRGALTDQVPRTGGHLGSNLGVVELTIALHCVFDFSRDQLVFDVSHQCYPHKMLTGRANRFGTLRQTGGMSGFTNRFESPFDVLTAGHAGTAISFAMGLAEGQRGSASPDGEDPWSVALVGDAGLACGVAFEGLNHAGERRPRMLVVLNDNEWSIARSVGAMARYLSRLRSSRTVQFTYERVKALVEKLPWVGERIEQSLAVLRHAIVPGHVFEELGVNYVGPLDGHDLEGCMEALERIKRLDGVHLIHFLTEKGRGYAPAADDPQRAHGVSPKQKVDPSAKTSARSSWTDAFAQALVELGAKDARVCALTAAMPAGTGLESFAEKYPDRFYDTGITEQHAVALAAGMATAGKRPVAAIYSTFLQRAYDQVFQEVALQKESVLFALDRAGLVGQDGPTHQGLYDLAFLRTLPCMVLASPRDAIDLKRMMQAYLEQGGPWALRWPRGSAAASLATPAELRPELVPGTAERVREGSEGVAFALGAMVEPTLQAAEIAADHGIEVEVWDARFAKPLDRGALADAARRHPWLATVEEHALDGGFGSAVAESFADLGVSTPLHRFGVPDRFIEHMSTREEQLALCGLTPEKLAAAWLEHAGLPSNREDCPSNPL